MKILCSVLLASCFVLSGCGSRNSDSGPPIYLPNPAKPATPVNPVNPNGDGIISEDFLNEDTVFPDAGTPRFMSVIKLKSPALLESATRNSDGTFTVDPDEMESVLAEQTQLEADLQNISTEIKVLYRYRMVLNAISIDAPQSLAEEISQLNVNFIEADERFARPKVLEEVTNTNKNAQPLNVRNSMSFIGVDKIHKTLTVVDQDGNTVPVRGQGMKVGIIDSGVDYTHKMFGGPGTEADFLAIDPNTLPKSFPTARVVGGFDFAGGSYNPGSHIFTNKIPTPDPNPLDQSGHGTHVAGTTAGQGDGVNTYDGAAPEAEIFALKVFGDGEGGTSDQTVIAALEYAADPNGDLSPDDKLDVVNLSLGSGFGKPHNLYAQAITNLSRGGTVVAASAGNSGPIANIVGAPSTSVDAISVAASVDYMEHNWRFQAVEFVTSGNPSLLAKAIEGTITEPIATAGAIQGKLVFIGTAETDLDDDQKAALKGHIALIDRGGVAFSDKIQRATDAGALGIVMVNNQDGPAIRMGGDPSIKFAVPGVMVTKEIGDLLKSEMLLGDAVVSFQTPKVIEEPELIDTLTGFSSQGPRDLDALIKPEISAPGLAIISARMGSGNLGVQFGGTSMSAPHIAGIIALVKQYKGNLSSKQVKSLILNTGTLISDEEGVTYPISRQGAGRVDAYRAATSDLVFSEPTLSLGKIQVETKRSIFKTVMVKNISEAPGVFEFAAKTNDNIQVTLSDTSLTIDAGSSVEIGVSIEVSSMDPKSTELDAFIQVLKGTQVVGSLPILAVVNRRTQMAIESLLVDASDLQGSPGASAEITINNKGLADGQALLFNLLGRDDRKTQTDPMLSVACDLESVGYRVVEKEGVAVLQVAAKLYNPVTSWRTCDLNVEFDLDGDNMADKEIMGSSSGAPSGLGALDEQGLGSVFVDSKIVGAIYSKYLEELAAQPEDPPVLNFAPALLGARVLTSFDHSTLAIVEVDLPTLGLTNSAVQLKVSVSYNGRSRDVVEANDSLSNGASEWTSVTLTDTGSGYHNIPESVDVPAGSRQSVTLVKGQKTNERLIAYFPRNAFTLVTTAVDQQAQIPAPTFKVPPVVVP